MGYFSSVEAATEFFKDDHYMVAAGIVIKEFDERHAVCEMEIRDDLHRNAIGAVMGGALFTLGDAALTVAANNIHFPSVGLTGNINFLSGTKRKTLIATAKCVKDGGNTGVYEINIADDAGKAVAFMTGTVYKLRQEK